MATKPVVKNITGSSIGIINKITASEGGYLAGAPRLEDTPQSMRQFAEWLTSYEPRQNQFLSALVNRIGMVIISSKAYSNPWAWAKKGVLDYGETLEDIFTELARTESFKPGNSTNETLADLFSKRIPSVTAAFSTVNFAKKYVASVSQDQLTSAFSNASGVTRLLETITTSLYSGLAYDEFIVYKYSLYRAALDGKLYVEKIPNVTTISNSDAKKLVAQVKSLSNEMTFEKTQFNPAHVLTFTPKQDQMFIKDTELDAVLDVEVLSLAFNMDKSEVQARSVLIDHFGDDELKRLALILYDDETRTSDVFTSDELKAIATIKGFLLDKNFLMQYDKWLKMTEQYIPNELRWNYFLHHSCLIGWSPFKACVVLTTATSSVNSVTTTPETFEATPGASVQLTTVVGTSGFIDSDVTYVSGDTSVATVDRNGLVTIVAGASAGDTCTITITAVGDTSKTDTVSVTVAGSTT